MNRVFFTYGVRHSQYSLQVGGILWHFKAFVKKYLDTPYEIYLYEIYLEYIAHRLRVDGQQIC